ncbi:hypothetical protein SpCBS45565_g00656 [Spizellomyces sp. 'palustris']|nr:hypothetical protein SpCBS45565_g00656 [Spizellomyces sp. 'palustris']
MASHAPPKVTRRSTLRSKSSNTTNQIPPKTTREKGADRTKKAQITSKTGESLGVIESLRRWRKDAWDQNLWSTASYWGDKILTIGGEPQDYYWQAKIYFATGEFARADYLLSGNPEVLESSIQCRYMGALCAVKLGKWDKADTLLRDKAGRRERTKIDEPSGIKLEASICYLQGIVHSRKGELKRANERMKQAVIEDPRCIEAFNWLLNNHVMNVQEEETFVNTLDFGICGQDADFMRSMYLSSIKKYDEAKISHLETTYKLAGNSDVLHRRAEHLFEQCRYSQCYEITSRIVKDDPFNLKCVPIHVSCLSELGMKNDLFYFAHQLVETFPDRACTWFAVGGYYLLIKKNLEARKYFSKCTQLDGSFGPGWLGFAHSFAAEGETDQAISAYSTAAKLFNGIHLPLMYLGMHYSLVNNLELASDYLHLAENMNKTDPLLMNELGTLYSRKKDHQKAIFYFERALVLADNTNYTSVQWEATWFNLALTHRKLRNYAKGREYIDKVLEINHNLFDAHALLGYIAHAENKLEAAIGHYSDALSYNPDDTMCHDLMREAMADVQSVYDDPECWPRRAEFNGADDSFLLPPDLEQYRVFEDLQGSDSGPFDTQGTPMGSQEGSDMDESPYPQIYTPETAVPGSRTSFPERRSNANSSLSKTSRGLLSYGTGSGSKSSPSVTGSPYGEDTSLGSPSIARQLATGISSFAAGTSSSRFTPQRGRQSRSNPRLGWPPRDPGGLIFGSSPVGAPVPQARRTLRDVRGMVSATPSDGDVSMDMEIDDLE